MAHDRNPILNQKGRYFGGLRTPFQFHRLGSSFGEEGSGVIQSLFQSQVDKKEKVGPL